MRTAKQEVVWEAQSLIGHYWPTEILVVRAPDWDNMESTLCSSIFCRIDKNSWKRFVFKRKQAWGSSYKILGPITLCKGSTMAFYYSFCHALQTSWTTKAPPWVPVVYTCTFQWSSWLIEELVTLKICRKRIVSEDLITVIFQTRKDDFLICFGDHLKIMTIVHRTYCDDLFTDMCDDGFGRLDFRSCIWMDSKALAEPGSLVLCSSQTAMRLNAHYHYIFSACFCFQPFWKSIWPVTCMAQLDW